MLTFTGKVVMATLDLPGGPPADDEVLVEVALPDDAPVRFWLPVRAWPQPPAKGQAVELRIEVVS